MRYLGGKAKIAKQLAKRIRDVVGAEAIWEPFVGGLNVTPHLQPVIASDINPNLIALYEYARHNDLPRTITELDYQAAKQLPDGDPLKAFIGFGCSFGGKWFGGFAKGENRNYAAEAARSIERDTRRCAGVRFECLDFLGPTPAGAPRVLYLDPPYRGTTRFALQFDFERFDARVLDYAQKGFTVLISEYALPYGTPIWAADKHVGLRSGVNRQDSAHRTEKLFLVA